MDKALEVLKKYWGFDSFRPLQDGIVKDSLDSKDVVALLPTGGGKSLCFQVPALVRPGVCLVISPLISLMNDQVERLNHQGIKAIAITSSMSKREIDIALENAVVGAYKFIYASPERLTSELFLLRLLQMDINLVAIDEAHCVSQWGYDFRPAYLKISELKEKLTNVPFMALTATAKPQVVQDIIDKIGLEKVEVHRGKFTRENLVFGVVQTENKHKKLIQWLESVKGPAIVYSRSRKKTREWSEFLNLKGIPSDFYHAGLKPEVRAQKQMKWSKGSVRVMVATTAFGMGIDKGDVRLVLHPELPENPESYIQESGRAGRDGATSFCIVLLGPEDTRYLKTKIHGEMPSLEFIRNLYKTLCAYCKVAYGTGQFSHFKFDEGFFVKKHNLPLAKTYMALKFLDQQGLIAYNEAGRPYSAIRIIAETSKLYDLEDLSPEKDAIIKILLRSYGGITTDFVKINDRVIAKKLGISRDDLYQKLVSLSKERYIDYIPKEDGTIIEFLTDRPKEKHLPLSEKEFAIQMDRKEQGLQGIIRYVENQITCRQEALVNYLEIEKGKPCGKCDVCRGVFSPLTPDDEKKAYELLKNPIQPLQLSKALNKSEKLIFDWLRERLGEESVLFLEDGTFVLK